MLKMKKLYLLITLICAVNGTIFSMDNNNNGAQGSSGYVAQFIIKKAQKITNSINEEADQEAMANQQRQVRALPAHATLPPDALAIYFNQQIITSHETFNQKIEAAITGNDWLSAARHLLDWTEFIKKESASTHEAEKTAAITQISAYKTTLLATVPPNNKRLAAIAKLLERI
jgi:hypothetical protein